MSFTDNLKNSNSYPITATVREMFIQTLNVLRQTLQNVYYMPDH